MHHQPIPEPDTGFSELDLKIKRQNAPAGGAADYALPLSIIAAAVFISASIFYNTRLVLKKIDSSVSLGFGQASSSTGPNPESSPAPAPSAVLDPGAPVNAPQRAGAPVLGNKNAKVAMVEFSDFQCPFCQRFFKNTLPQIKSKYIDTDKVKFVYRHFPLPRHQNAQKAAEAAECASRQGKFEAYHNQLFINGQPDGAGLAAADLKKYADDLGLNKGVLGFKKNQFNQCLDNSETAEAVKKDIADGAGMSVGGTPTFLIFKADNPTFDLAYINQQLQQRQNIIKLANGNYFIVGAQAHSAFEQAIEAVLK